MNISSDIEGKAAIVIFDQYTQIKEAKGQGNLIRTYFPELFKIDAHLKEIDWERVFVKPPSFGGDKVELLQTIDGHHFLVFLDYLKRLDLWIMLIIDMDQVNMLKFEPFQRSKIEDGDFLYESTKMKRIIDIIYQVAGVNSTILLLGESGVGKTRLAHMIHHASNRAEKPFISINCGTIPETLIESELFGYEEGAFTGSRRGGRKGLFEEADTGTIFLDEIAELPLHVQVKLLDVLQENKIRKVGSTKSKQVDIRVIAATNKDIKAMVDQKLFREDLYYRLNVVPLTIPPLRERMEEVPYLVDHFVTKSNQKYGLNMRLDKEVEEKLMKYHWPGNIRELENVVERIVVTNSYDYIPGKSGGHPSNSVIETKGIIPLKEAKQLVEKDLISRAYKKYRTTYKAAEVLGVDQSTVAKKIKQYNIQK
ncbi:hypothetical protein J6TS1_25790 [Siminovitchia terrae]|uniref:HTH-type transcriptional regulatory protein TyrR n=1 Tax=Siminovitchia terrae TaxID=1914933 RepID=A0ABQ4KXH8_SIMTE|nr:sigma 54-interacting transcriptional regulator [Siminovitchia terrae]GIN96709.1 hypothetical protein J6TS1_25790 [Siminovitchia terrae]